MDDFNKKFDQAFNEAIKNYSSTNQFGVSFIPAHKHNGTDSQQVDIKDIARFPSNPTNGQIPTFNSTTNQWEASTSSSNGSAVFWRVGFVVAGSGTLYVSNVLASTTESETQIPCPISGTISNLYVLIATAQPNDGALTLTFRKAGADTTLVATVAANASAWTVVSDTTHSFSVTAGNLIDIKAVNASGSNSASISQVIFKII